MEYRGQTLLKKWLEGDTTYHEELELFAIAEQDPVIREALEGYIGQQHIQSPVVPVGVKVLEHPKARTEQNRRSRLAVFRFVAALVVLFAAGGIYLSTQNVSGEAASIVKSDLETTAPQDRVITTAAVTSNEQKVVSVVVDPVEFIADKKSIDHDAGSVTESNETLVALADEKPSEIISNDEPVEKTGTVELQYETELIADGKVIEEPVQSGAESPVALNMGLENFDDELDENFRRNVRFQENEAGVKVTTGYEIDVVPGNFGTTATMESGASQVNNSDVQGKVNMADAANRNNNEVRTNAINNNLVVTEYVIPKRDLTYQPVQDFNSMVREKYRRKTKPVEGFFSYRKFLKAATKCLIEGQSNVDHLEEGVIKFRVHKDGNIEFLDFFGTQADDCVQSISASVIHGPKWEVKGFYESLDIEVPFKTLYPYLF
ncbi:MAG: hypothetical protein GY751_21040 [Bacteroidetes bacterium]|nr:hypothetical protein [Bacteroidota bacterium]